MHNLSNTLSLLRAPLALVFLQSNPSYRLLAVFLAMLTDSIDGYLARKWNSTSVFGAIIDPLMDKFFVYFALLALFADDAIPLWACFTIVSRDFFVVIHGLYLQISGKWKNYRFQSVKFGKLTTALQFFVLASLIVGYSFPASFYLIFILFGCFAFIELLSLSMQTTTQ